MNDNIIRQNLLELKSGIIGHQVNCVGTMGSGLAYKIGHQYGTVYGKYKRLCKKKANNPVALLGTVQEVPVNKHLTVLNLFGQLYVSRKERMTDYYALEAIAHKLEWKQKEEGYGTIYLPFNMGCGLGGGDWETVWEIFTRVEIFWCRHY